MSYTYNGTQISVMCPVHNISVNKYKVAFADKCGQKWAPSQTPLKQNNLSLGYLILSNKPRFKTHKKTGAIRFFQFYSL